MPHGCPFCKAGAEQDGWDSPTLYQHAPTDAQVRFEDLRFQFNATIRGIAEQLYAPYSPEVLLRAAHAAKCDPGTWDEQMYAQEAHVTYGKDEGRTAVLRTSLLRDASIRRHICMLQKVMGYPQEEECGDGESAGAQTQRP